MSPAGTEYAASLQDGIGIFLGIQVNGGASAVQTARLNAFEVLSGIVVQDRATVSEY